jgi:hypothetical protein
MKHVETFTPHNEILIFEEQSCVSHLDFYIFDTDQAKINSVGMEPILMTAIQLGPSFEFCP